MTWILLRSFHQIEWIQYKDSKIFQLLWEGHIPPLRHLPMRSLRSLRTLRTRHQETYPILSPDSAPVLFVKVTLYSRLGPFQ